MSVYSLGVVAGSGLALILGGLAVAATSRAGAISLPLLGEMRSWQAAFVIVGLPGLVAALLMLTVQEPSRKERGPGGGGLDATFAFARRGAGLLGLMSTGFGLGGATIAFGLGAWLPTLFIRVHGWAPAQAAGAMGAILLSFGIGGVLAGGWLADRGLKRGALDSPLKIAIAGVACMIPAVPVVGLASEPWLSLAAFAWINFFLGMPTALAVPALHNITPNQQRGQVTAFYLFATNLIGLAIGPTLIALTTDRVFDDGKAVGLSLTLVITTAATLGLLLLLSARKAYARHLASSPRRSP